MEWPLKSFLYFAILVEAACCEPYDIVVSGVFETTEVLYNYTSAVEFCQAQNATIATLDQVTKAYNNSFQTCRWGWVEEQRNVMARVTADKKCANKQVGLLQKLPCRYYEAPSAYCHKANVVRGVFQLQSPNGKYNLTLQDGLSLCQRQNATIATYAQLEDAYKAGYETCRAGWAAEGKVYIPRQNSSPSCFNGTVGLLEYFTNNGSFDVFCFTPGLLLTNVYVVYPPSGVYSFIEANQSCDSLGDSLASEEDLKQALVSLQSHNLTTVYPVINGWNHGGDVVKILENGTLVKTPCVNNPNATAAVYCFNPNVTDFIPGKQTDNKLWLKIMMGCFLALIFIFLLLAAACMKGNQCICCLRWKKKGKEEVVQNSEGFATNRNGQGPYKAMREITDPLHVTISGLPIEQRPPALYYVQDYRTHVFVNRGYENNEQE